MKNGSFRARLGYAAAGIRTAWKREKSFRTQCACGLAAILGTVAIRPGAAWTALVFLAAGFVLALELANAALEYLIDHLHPGIAAEIGRSKDAAAGAVLVASVAALAVAAAMLLSTLT